MLVAASSSVGSSRTAPRAVLPGPSADRHRVNLRVLVDAFADRGRAVDGPDRQVLVQRARADRERPARLVPVQRDGHQLHRPRSALGRMRTSSPSTAGSVMSCLRSSSSTPCSRRRSSSRTDGSSTTPGVRTAASARWRPLPTRSAGGPSNSSRSHKPWTCLTGPGHSHKRPGVSWILLRT